MCGVPMVYFTKVLYPRPWMQDFYIVYIGKPQSHMPIDLYWIELLVGYGNLH